MANGSPRVSFGIPIYNAERLLGRALESIASQDFGDFEVVMCDNASTDSTGSICSEFSSRDPRFRYVRNDENIGQNANFNKTFELSRGELFRWIGSDDYLESTYLSKSLAALDQAPSAIGVTTLFRFVDDEGNIIFKEYLGRRPDSNSRFARVTIQLWLHQSHRVYFDPMYTLFKREALERAGLLLLSDPQDILWGDKILALHLSILGPYCHVNEILSTRQQALGRNTIETDAKTIPQLHPSTRNITHRSLISEYHALARVMRQRFSGWQRPLYILLVYLYFLRRFFNLYIWRPFIKRGYKGVKRIVSTTDATTQA